MPGGFQPLRLIPMGCLLICVALGGPSALAEARGSSQKQPAREAASQDGKHVLELRPGDGKSRPCRATLRQTKARRDPLWARRLVNARGPMQAFVQDGGAFTVTLDDVRWGGARNAVAAYDARGAHLRTWKLSELLRREDWRHVTLRKPAIEWLDKARTEFAGADVFQIKLPWGRTLRFDLRQALLLDAPTAEELAGAVPAEAAAILAEAEAGERDARGWRGEPSDGADIAAVEDAAAQIAEESSPSLAVEWMLLQAMAAAQMVAAAESSAAQESVGGDAGSSADVSPVAGDIPFHELQPATAPSESGGAETARYVVSDPAHASGVNVPLPDPARPTNYLEWLKQQTDTGDPSAQIEMRAAVAKSVKFDGDQELLSRALKGDAVALQDPTIATWRAANADALRHYRDFTLYPYRGPELNSPDGSMIGILLPALGPMRELTRVAVLDARAKAAEGNHQESADLLSDALRAGARMGQGPTLIENLVGTAMQSLASDALLDLAADPRARSADFAQIAAAMELASEKPRPLAEGMQFERASVFDVIQRGFEYDSEAQTYRPLVKPLMQFVGEVNGGEQPGALATLQIATLDYHSTVETVNSIYDELTESVVGPYTTQRDRMETWEREFVAAPRNPLLRGMIPVISRAAANRGKGDSKHHAALLVQNLMAYQQQHGVLPDSLSTFENREFANDPLTGQPFRYERTADGFRLYSVGLNGLDDGGVHDARGEVNDLVYWPRP